MVLHNTEKGNGAPLPQVGVLVLFFLENVPSQLIYDL